MNVPDRIQKLIETFDYNLEAYRKGSYNETQARREFIDPFFEELGWDVTNKQGHAEAATIRFLMRLRRRTKQ